MAGRSYGSYSAARMGAQNNCAIATTSTAVFSSTFATNTYQIRISCPAVCYYAVSDVAAPVTASTASIFLPNTWVDYVTVTPGQKVSVFSSTIQTISVTEITG